MKGTSTKNGGWLIKKTAGEGIKMAGAFFSSKCRAGRGCRVPALWNMILGATFLYFRLVRRKRIGAIRC